MIPRLPFIKKINSQKTKKNNLSAGDKVFRKIDFSSFAKRKTSGVKKIVLIQKGFVPFA